jgi:hypothetical protein
MWMASANLRILTGAGRPSVPHRLLVVLMFVLIEQWRTKAT